MATVKKILEKKGSEVYSIAVEASALEAARVMNARLIGALIVVDGDRVVGIVTERDILRRLVALGRDPERTRVRLIMSTPVACCRLDTSLEECRAVMTEKRIRHLPVVEDACLRGIVTSGDILAQEIEAHQTTIHWLNEYLYSPLAPFGT